MRFRLLLLSILFTVAPVSHALAAAVVLSQRAEACILSASEYHKVNANIMRAIVALESRGRKHVVSQNTDGSIDVGLTGVNSVHFPDLIKKGVAPHHLMDECVAVYVGAWKLSQSIFRYGNTWKAVGAYNSRTPYFNERYQALVYNELVNMGVASPPKLLVPPSNWKTK